jgi:hypothetical protein
MEMPTNKNFGLTFSIIFLIIGLFPIMNNRAHLWAILLSIFIFTIAYLAPKTLTIPNIIWFKIGQSIHSFTSPVALAAIFYLVVTPIGFISRSIFKNDPLGRTFNPNLKSYWALRQPPGPNPESLNNQF